MTGAYQAKDTLLQKYLAKVKDLIKKFYFYKVCHVPREEIVWADILSKLANTKPEGNNKSLIQETLRTFSISKSDLNVDHWRISELNNFDYSVFV